MLANFIYNTETLCTDQCRICGVFHVQNEVLNLAEPCFNKSEMGVLELFTKLFHNGHPVQDRDSDFAPTSHLQSVPKFILSQNTLTEYWSH